MFALTRRSLKIRKIKEAQFRKMSYYLEPGDLIFFRTRFHPSSWLIRYMSESYWNHVAIVLTTLDTLPGYRSVLIAEAQSSGIEVHRIQKFFNYGIWDIGVKRFPGLSQTDRENLT